MGDISQGIALLKAKLGFETLYDGVEPKESDRSFFGGADFFDVLIRNRKPRLIIEVGSWMGHSAVHISRKAVEASGEIAMICVDTWLGSSEHYFDDAHLADLALTNGRPDFYRQFLANVLFHHQQDHIIPLSLPSHTGYEILAKLGLSADLIYIDAGHGYNDVKRDVTDYSKLLSASGVIVGDDYFYPPVKRAVDDFAKARGLHVASYGNRGQKWVLVRSRDEAETLLEGLPLAGFI